MNMRASLHPFKLSTNNINRGSKGGLRREINLKVSKDLSNHHPERDIPTQNEMIF